MPAICCSARTRSAIAILCDVPRTASVRAVTDLTTLCISKDLFFRLINEFPQMAVQIMRVLAQRLEKTTRQLRQAVTGHQIGVPE
jgi:CRP/FNR family cyclic AMP-dependent transcriptional regulator